MYLETAVYVCKAKGAVYLSLRLAQRVSQHLALDGQVTNAQSVHE